MEKTPTPTSALIATATFALAVPSAYAIMPQLSFWRNHKPKLHFTRYHRPLSPDDLGEEHEHPRFRAP